MKTLKQVKEEIDNLIKTGAKVLDEKEKNRIRNRLQFLKPLVLYMTHNPTEKSINRQLIECLKRIDLIQKEFDTMYPSYCDAKTKSEFMKGKGLSELKKQVKILQYILELK